MFSLNSNSMPLISPSNNYTFQISLSDSALSSIPYPYPVVPYTLASSNGQLATDSMITPLPAQNQILIAIANMPATITGNLTFTNSTPAIGFPVTLYQNGNIVGNNITNHYGNWQFSENVNHLALNVATTVVVLLNKTGTVYYLNTGTGWTSTPGQATLSLSSTQYGRGITTPHNAVLSALPPPVTPTVTPSTTPPSTTPTRAPSTTPSGAPSMTPSGAPSTVTPSGTPSQVQTPVNSSTSSQGSQGGGGLLGIGVGASIGVIVGIAVVVIIVVIVVIVIVIKVKSGLEVV